MGQKNIDRLKDILGNVKYSKNDKLFNLIDLIYYEKKHFQEEDDPSNGGINWYFEDGETIKLNGWELVVLALILADLSKVEKVFNKKQIEDIY
jgi:hypothetical protein